MPEAKLAREAEIAYALVALPSDYDCWRPHPGDLDKHELLKEIIGNLMEATKNAIQLIKTAVERFDRIADTPSPAHSALELAVWSNKEGIPSQAKERVQGLLGKYV
jgi:5'-methylthioadenosine phosphorylase